MSLDLMRSDRARRRASSFLPLFLAMALASACGDGETSPLTGTVSGDEAGATAWVAVVETGPDEDALRTDLKLARAAVGDYYADQIVITDAACYEGLPALLRGSVVLAIQDESEHGVHALYLELVDDPPFYGEVTLVC